VTAASRVILCTELISDLFRSLSQRTAKEYSLASLAQTTKVLDINPEFYTIWNFRREILLGGLLDGQVLTCSTAVLTWTDG